jgi:amino-acid N-acetyltransferase
VQDIQLRASAAQGAGDAIKEISMSAAMPFEIGLQPTHGAVTELLATAELPTSDITPGMLRDFLFAGSAAAPLGIVGLEIESPHALLRSLVVDASLRSTGVGSKLLAAAEAHASSRGVRGVYLLTTTAESFFAKHGYMRTSREEAPPFIRSSSEFASLCPASAAFMLKML